MSAIMVGESAWEPTCDHEGCRAHLAYRHRWHCYAGQENSVAARIADGENVGHGSARHSVYIGEADRSEAGLLALGWTRRGRVWRCPECSRVMDLKDEPGSWP